MSDCTSLTQDQIDALQKLIEGTEVNIDDIIATGQGITLQDAQQLLAQKGYIEDARNLKTRLKESKLHIYKEQMRAILLRGINISLLCINITANRHSIKRGLCTQHLAHYKQRNVVTVLWLGDIDYAI